MACLAALALVGCSTPDVAPAPVEVSSPSPRTSASAAVPEAAAACRVELPDRWRSALEDGVVTPDDGEVLTVVLGTSDSTTFVVSDVRGAHHTLEWRRGGERRVVQDLGLDHPEWQVLGATWDGRHLAYRVDRSYASFEDFALYVWDSEGDRPPVEVAHGEPDRHGDLMQTPFVDPVLADGWVYWTQTRDADPGHTVLSGRRLSDGRTEQLSRGYGRAPVRFGQTLVWADSDGPGETSRLRMLDLATHTPMTVRAALDQVRGVFYLAGDDDTLVWVAGAKGRQVHVWRTGWPQPRLLVGQVASPQFPRIAGDVVVLAGDDAMYAADLRSWSYAQVTPSYGGTYADGGPIVNVGYAPTDKNASSLQTLIDTNAAGALGRSGC